MTDRLTADGFRQWLEAQPPRKSVGIQGQQDRCPLARYLSAGSAGGDRWLVYPDYAVQVSAPDEGDPRPLPRAMPFWAKAFVGRVDGLAAVARSGDARRISPRLALELLDEAVAEAEEQEAQG